MKQLVCEMCGGTDLIKQDGVFVCQSCGCKYSVEEAKKMMIEGTVRVDNSHMIGNYLEMAERAFASSNNVEAETYCNKIIEIEPNNYQALMLKGKAAGWQSTLQDVRIGEAINCFIEAISYAPEDEKQNLIEIAKEEISKFSLGLMKLRGDRFAKWPDKGEMEGLLDVLLITLQSMIQFCGTVGLDASNMDECREVLATQLNNSVISAWNNVIVPEYKQDTDGHPDDYAFKQLIERSGYCTELIAQAIKLVDANDEANIQRYKNLIAFHQFVISSCSYEYKTVKAGYSSWDGSTIWKNMYVKKLELTAEAKAIREKDIRIYQDNIKSIEDSIAEKEAAKAKALAEEEAAKAKALEEEKKKRIAEYWENHADEKAKLEDEKNGLQAQVEQLRSEYDLKIVQYENEIKNIPEKKEVSDLREKIKKLTDDKDKLGIFSGKEKKVLQEEIDKINNTIKDIQYKIDAKNTEINMKISEADREYRIKVDSITTRTRYIMNELTRDR